MESLTLNNVVTDSTPISKLINILEKRGHAFVIHGNSVDGIVTLDDINKSIVRLYLFGVISLFEIHLSFWIIKCRDSSSWEKEVTTERLEAAKNLFDRRKKHNTSLSLLDCLQFCAKRKILKRTPEYLERFGYTRQDFEKTLEAVETIRNEIAHSQNSIFVGHAFSHFASVVSFLENALTHSENEIDSLISNNWTLVDHGAR